ncbi:MAG: serpin family protein [Bacteroidetes bacterium]|nr:serpin family protein [Bacteroidota bacterium]
MKPAIKLTASLLLLSLLSAGCNQEVDPVFDYNLKSAKVIETNNNFGLELLKSVFENDDEPNIMISPASVSIALGMTYNGAETTTMDAFEEVLNYEGLTREEANEITRELIKVLVTNTKGNLLEIANSIWHDEEFPVKQEFIDLNTNYYDARVKELDFSKSTAVSTINNWVSSKTHEKIDEIIDSIDPSTMMILINAIYFNCVWKVEFDPKDTYDAPFYTETGTKFGVVDMMQLESTFNVAWADNFRAVELPYKNNKFSMFLFLPDEGTTVDDLVQELDGETWNQWRESFSEVKDYEIELPRFEFEFGRSLKEDLKAMGLEVAFTDYADFSGISDISLLISDVIHKTYIKVNEEGTEAAAVTAVIMDVTSAGPGSILRFDRPFLFAITENSSKSILFMGKVSEPSY